METAAVILAGGRSRRMGRDKAELALGEDTFLSALVRRYRPLFGRVWVSVSRSGVRLPAGVEELPDLRPGQGPLAGLESAFAAAGAEMVFLTAVDLPFGDPALARRLMERMGGAEACLIRRKNGRLEPLFALYRACCLPAITTCLDQGRRAVGALLDRVDCRLVEEEELRGFDLERVLFNVNTGEDYRRALELEGEK